MDRSLAIWNHVSAWRRCVLLLRYTTELKALSTQKSWSNIESRASATSRAHWKGQQSYKTAANKQTSCVLQTSKPLACCLQKSDAIVQFVSHFHHGDSNHQPYTFISLAKCVYTRTHGSDAGCNAGKCAAGRAHLQRSQHCRPGSNATLSSTRHSQWSPASRTSGMRHCARVCER